MSGNMQLYSIQRTYIITREITPEKVIFTCDKRIDIPTIEPLSSVQTPFSYQPLIIIPCIELAGEFLSEFDLTFETNEGVTVLPIKIDPAQGQTLGNPYTHFRYVLVLPRGSTGVKSCRLINKATGEEVQNNFTFGIMPSPYNYDDALFGVITFVVSMLVNRFNPLQSKINNLKLIKNSPYFSGSSLKKNAGKQTIRIEKGVLFYNTSFNYPLSPEPTIHNPKITFHSGGRDQVYTLSLNKTKNTVSIDLFTGMITVYTSVTGEIMQQLKIDMPSDGFERLSFEDFDDIDDSTLHVVAQGARVE